MSTIIGRCPEVDMHFGPFRTTVLGAWKPAHSPRRAPLVCTFSIFLAAGLMTAPLTSASADCAPVFTEVPAGLPGVGGPMASVDWGDYDNDGDLDILLRGKIYRNSGGANPTFTDIGTGLSGWATWGDYDNDGDLDILLCATGIKVYRNNGGANPTFTDIGAGLSALYNASGAWGDYDNDGNLDILVMGQAQNEILYTTIYRNSGGPNPTFSAVAGLPGVYFGSAAWGDYDNDGDLDVLLGGDMQAGGGMITRVYRNNGGTNPTFTNIGAGLPGMSWGSVAWGDYDNDGDVDILAAGAIIGGVYRNSGGPNPTFSDANAGLPPPYPASVAWGDCDNDGDLDILLTGDAGPPITRVYLNSGGANPTFSDAGAGLPGSVGNNRSLAWADYDNDGDLDVLVTAVCVSPCSNYSTKLYRNSGCTSNTTPSAPGGLVATIGPSGTTFSWNAASDAETPASGLTYNLRVGTTPGGSEILSAMSAPNGYRRVARMGTEGQRLSWTLAVPQVNYYWSVQAIDAALAGSPFASEHQTVDVPGPAVAAGFMLHPNQPNPFSRTTRIVFELPREARVRLTIHDVSGRQVRMLVDHRRPAGRNEVEWDGRGPRGDRYHDGVYFCVMEADGFRSTQRIVLAR